MKVHWKESSDAQRLRDLVRDTTNAKQRDRYRVALIAGEGLGEQPELHREQIAAAVGRSRQFVDQWVGRYRRGGIEALTHKRQRGYRRARKLIGIRITPFFMVSEGTLETVATMICAITSFSSSRKSNGPKFDISNVIA